MPQKVLLLGAGLVVKPIVTYLSKHGFEVTVASRGLEKAQALVEGSPAKAIKLDIENDADLPMLEERTKESDLVISMLPWLLHAKAAEMAVKNGKHFLTTSYLSDAMRALDGLAKEKGVVMINECGVDPGTDHMSASRVMDAAKAAGGKIIRFTSFCGGLPSPQSNNNPFGYKFSWAPRGVLLAAMNAAKFYRDGEVVEVPEKLWETAETMEVQGFDKPFQGVPNRNSCQYREIYNLPDIKTLLRGTFRYADTWADLMVAITRLGMLDVTERDLTGTYKEMLLRQAGAAAGDDVKKAVSEKTQYAQDHYVIAALEWLGLFSDQQVTEKTLLDSVCFLMKNKPEMQYAPGEKDMIVMKHTYEVEYPDRTEFLSTVMTDYGLDDGTTSMSRTVGIPVAIAARMVLQGSIKLTGIQIPIVPDIYNPILDELEKEGVVFHDATDKVVKK
eukprot:TRINITY_DN723_c0_g1_i1.p1 TRINITY_DN723_c0_g1~~TRINITY_DN723_c0_g1_i1.p1  ORF type:complete len:445 (+),score=239.58 TRINITY_DN723_c0_g1_i1:58-1392(+)